MSLKIFRYSSSCSFVDYILVSRRGLVSCSDEICWCIRDIKTAMPRYDRFLANLSAFNTVWDLLVAVFARKQIANSILQSVSQMAAVNMYAHIFILS